ncbi:MAG: hypothetical protein ACE368_20560 [Paracoccaceae bacterium]
MTRAGPERRALALWAMAAGLALWAPAVAVPGLPLPLQPMDVLAILGWPLIAVFLPRVRASLVLVLGSGAASIGLSWAVSGGEALILGWTIGCAFPAVAALALAVADPLARSWFTRAVMAARRPRRFCSWHSWRWGQRRSISARTPPFACRPSMAGALPCSPRCRPSRRTCFWRWRWGWRWRCAGHRRRARRAAAGVVLLCLCALILSRSTSVLVVLPPLAVLVLARTSRASVNALVLAGLASLALAGLIALFLQSVYAERLETDAATRSAAMRLASAWVGWPLVDGQVFGVGIGNDAWCVARLRGGAPACPQLRPPARGGNAQIVGRIFEEGWPAVAHLCAAGWLLALVLARGGGPVALACLAAASLLTRAVVG